jgi:hypothetical protein
MTRLNKLVAITYQSSLTFAGKTRNLPRRKHLKDAPIGLALALPSNSKTWQERVSKVKNSSLLGLVVNDEGKKFYSIDTWSVNQRVDKTTPPHFEIHSKEKIFTSKMLNYIFSSEFLFREKASVFVNNDWFWIKKTIAKFFVLNVP